jgi:hypothetical protein
VAGDPDFGIPIGTPSLTGSYGVSPWVITNLAGETLSLTFDGSDVNSMTVTALGAGVPDGGSSLVLVGMALLGLVAARKMRT